MIQNGGTIQLRNVATENSFLKCMARGSNPQGRSHKAKCRILGLFSCIPSSLLSLPFPSPSPLPLLHSLADHMRPILMSLFEHRQL